MEFESKVFYLGDKKEYIEYLGYDPEICNDEGYILVWKISNPRIGQLVQYATDNMEPEDAIFPRDLSWIAVAIKDAYELGKGERS